MSERSGSEITQFGVQKDQREIRGISMIKQVKGSGKFEKSKGEFIEVRRGQRR